MKSIVAKTWSVIKTEHTPKGFPEGEMNSCMWVKHGKHSMRGSNCYYFFFAAVIFYLTWSEKSQF